jgi:hypothetical protein
MIQPLEPILIEELIAHVASRTQAKPRLILAHGLYRYTGDPRGESIDLAAVERIGYRAFVRVGTKTLVAVDCVTAGETKSYRIHLDAIAASWLLQVRLLRHRKQLAGARCELRLLLVQAHHLMFFWLAFPSGDGNADLFLQTREAAGASGRQRLLARSGVESLIQKSVSQYAAMVARRDKLLAEVASRT